VTKIGARCIAEILGPAQLWPSCCRRRTIFRSIAFWIYGVTELSSWKSLIAVAHL